VRKVRKYRIIDGMTYPLSQRSAIYELVRNYLGDRYRPDQDCRSLLSLDDKRELVQRVIAAIDSGSIRTNGNGERKQIAQRILDDALARHKNLNGGRALPKKSFRRTVNAYQNAQRFDQKLNAIRTEIKRLESTDQIAVDKLRLHKRIYLLQLFIRCCGVALESLPEMVQLELGVEKAIDEAIVSALKAEGYSDKEIKYIVYGKT